MRILFVLENHYPNIGGVETLFKYLTEALVSKGYEVTILTNQFDKALKREETINGVKIIRVPFRNRYLFTLLALFPAIKLAKKHDVIHTTSYNAGIPAFFAGLFTRKKVLITFHEAWGRLWFKLPYMNKLVLALHYLFEKFLLLLPFYKFIAVSNSTTDSLVRCGVREDRIRMIYNGIDYKEFELKAKVSSTQNEPFTFVYFGRLGISKGLDILLRGIADLKTERTDFQLKLIIPKHPSAFHQRVRDLIQDYGIAANINIKSDLTKEVLINEIASSDAVVIPSYSEGFCFTAVESMALQVPIISSGKGALLEVVSGKHLTMPTHDAEGLKSTLVAALDGAWAFNSQKHFTLEASIKEYIELYSDLEQNQA